VSAPTKPGLRGAELRERIRQMPEWFCKDALGRNLWGKQIDIITSAFKNSRTAVAGCVSSGKTNAAAALVFCWLYGWGPGSRVFTLAPSFRQVDLNLWGEIPRMHSSARIPLGGKVYETTEFKLAKDWYALGFSTKEPEMVHGIHGPHDLLIVDDAHAVPEEMFDEIENMMGGGDTHIVLLYNPMRLSGTTYKARHSERKLWNPISISYWDTPNGKADKIVIPGTLKPEVVRAWIKKYGRNSNFVRVKVDAKEPKQEADTLIPLEWLELAKARLVPEPKLEDGTFRGQDVARFGDDDSARCEIRGRRTMPLISWNGHDTMRTAGELIAENRKRKGITAIDVIGVGAGVYDKCAEEEDVDVLAVNVSEKSLELDEAGKERFANLRSEIWWYAREALNPENPDALQLVSEDEDLVGELSSIKYFHDSKGRIVVESKEAMKKRLGKSPDKADAFCLAVHARRQGMGAGDLIHTMDEETIETERRAHAQELLDHGDQDLAVLMGGEDVEA
jgi:phage terminase large subunit